MYESHQQGTEKEKRGIKNSTGEFRKLRKTTILHHTSHLFPFFSVPALVLGIFTLLVLTFMIKSSSLKLLSIIFTVKCNLWSFQEGTDFAQL